MSAGISCKDYRIFLYCYCFENIQPITPFVGLSSQCRRCNLKIVHQKKVFFSLFVPGFEP